MMVDRFAFRSSTRTCFSFLISFVRSIDCRLEMFTKDHWDALGNVWVGMKRDIKGGGRLGRQRKKGGKSREIKGKRAKKTNRKLSERN
jgi:hypothetical protein